uniref:FAST kinase-like protein subdomain 2 domain-containing protein n=2 Tax=Dendroctonus ponderosae TaxID=77166 RepID=A0AAR5Q8N4_DENPD
MCFKQIFRKTWSIYKSQLNAHKVFPKPSFGCGGYVQKINVQCYSSIRTESKFYQTENYYAFQIVKSPAIGSQTTLSSGQSINTDSDFTGFLNKDWRKSNATEITKAFISVKPFCNSHNITVNDARFDCLVDGLMDNCENLTDSELLQLLQTLLEYPKCRPPTIGNFHDVWSCLDDICCWKMKDWDIETVFIFGDLWFKLGLSKIADFIFTVLDKFQYKADRLTKDQLVHMFFYFNVCRKRSIDFEYEFALQHKVHEMNVDEMAVVALGYFKTQTRIKIEPILEAVIREVTSSAMGIHEITLSGIMKALRFSYPHKQSSQINVMCNNLLPELDRFSTLACLHVALLATGVQTCHQGILRKCSQKIVEDVANIRLKDIERMLNVLTMFNFDPITKPDIYNLLFEEIHKDRRLSEINMYPNCLPSALHYFSLRGIYSYELMNRILDPEFISITFGKTPKLLPPALLSLDCCIDIECPDYKANRLTASTRYKAAKWQTEWAPSNAQFKKITAKQRLFLEILDTVKDIVGQEEFVHVNHVMPHFPIADIIVCKDLTTGAYTSTDSLKQYALGDIMKPTQDSNLKWYAILPFTLNNVVKYSNAPYGYSIMKLRQLEKIGYTPVVVLHIEFERLTPEERKQHILSKLV